MEKIESILDTSCLELLRKIFFACHGEEMSNTVINDIENDAEQIDAIVQKELSDIGVNSANFNGHKLLKKSGEKIPYTPEHIEEYKKCAENPVYFAENYVYIVNIERGREKIELYKYQKEMIENFAENRFNVVLSSRQSGKTTVTSTFLLWYILFHSDKSVGILANKARTAQMIVNRMQLSYTLLPKWLQQGVTDWNKQSFSLENGSRVISAATSSDSIRGESLNCVTGDTKVTILDKNWCIYHIQIDKILSISKESRNYYYQYKAVNKATKKEYTGYHQTDSLNDGFIGSGIELKQDIEKYGLDSFAFHIEKFFSYTRLNGYAVEIEDKEYYPVEDLQVLSDQGFKPFDGIRKSESLNKIAFVFDDGSNLTCTGNHLLKMKDGTFRKASSITNEVLHGNISVASFSYESSNRPVYDLVNVKDTQSYITNNVVSHNCLYIDEVAFIGFSIWEEFFRSVYPTISSSKSSKIILVSTPNGPNFFHAIWKKAQEGLNGYVPFQVNWWDVPGRDEKWKEEQIAATDEETFNQEFGCDFNTTTTTLIPSHKISYMETMALKPISFNKTMKVYKNPQKNHTYVLSCDVADQGIDYSVISVIDITEYPWEQVCVYRENISYIMFPPVIIHIANMYNNGYVLVENNDVGKTILHVLNYEYELENLITTQVSNRKGSSRYELGQRTTAKTKMLGCSQFKQLVNSNKIKINNDWTINEIKHFCIDSKGSYSADQPSEHDDCVMTLVNFSYFSTTTTYKLLFDKDVGEDIRAEEEKMIEESLLPIPMESRNVDDSEWTADEIKWVNQ